jgi:hypothetical protein
MHPSDTVSIPSQVMARQVGEETVILDLASGTYYGLDPVGARIWELLALGQTLAQVLEQMQSEYTVERERLEADVMALVHTLRDKQLLRVGP